MYCFPRNKKMYRQNEHIVKKALSITWDTTQAQRCKLVNRNSDKNGKKCNQKLNRNKTEKRES